MSKEAMKLALEALEWINRVNAMDFEYQRKARESLNAIYEALAEQPAQQEPSTLFESFQEFGEGWERLAWELCADENGEEACSELIWEGGPIPEPWGDRWLKYEDEAKRLIALVQKHTSPPAQPSKPLTDEQIEAIHQSTWIQSTATLNDFARAIEAAHGIKGDA